MNLKELIFASGTVGCGGAGFPTHAKLSGGFEHLIVNAAECEPLLRTDRFILRNFSDRLVDAASAVVAATGAVKCTFATKSAYREELAALKSAVAASGADISIFELESFYPAGDEQTLVCEVTGKAVPPAGIPLDVGCAVVNAATLLCIYDAVRGTPFTHKYLTVTGEVNSPTVLHVPLGTSFDECIALAGGAKDEDYFVVSGGPMMGKPMSREQSGEAVVTKTTSGILVLKTDSFLARQSEIPLEFMLNRAKSACIQCSFCTQLCPRNLLGHPLEPNKIMRKMALAESLDDILSDFEVRAAALCCECGICELYACPMSLEPRRVNAMIKARLSERGIRYEKGSGAQPPKAFRDFRKAPTRRVALRAGVGQYYDFVLDTALEASPKSVRLPLKEHIGAPGEPIVKSGDRVKAGELIAKCPDGKLGANLHASIDGTVTVGDGFIEIKEKERS